MLAIFRKTAIAGAMCMAAGVAQAAYPKKSIEVIVGYSAGGGTDVMARTIDREAEYDRDSFTYLANVVNDPNVIVTSKNSGLDTLDRLLAGASAKPGAITVGMSSLGGDDHFALVKLQAATETEFTIVPFKGSAPARTALLGGDAAIGILNISEVAEFQDQLTCWASPPRNARAFRLACRHFRGRGRGRGRGWTW